MIVDPDPDPQPEIVVGSAPKGYTTVTPLDESTVRGEMRVGLSLPDWGILTTSDVVFDVDDLREDTLLLNDGRTTTQAQLDRVSCGQAG